MGVAFGIGIGGEVAVVSAAALFDRVRPGELLAVTCRGTSDVLSGVVDGDCAVLISGLGDDVAVPA